MLNLRTISSRLGEARWMAGLGFVNASAGSLSSPPAHSFLFCSGVSCCGGLLAVRVGSAGRLVESLALPRWFHFIHGLMLSAVFGSSGFSKGEFAFRNSPRGPGARPIPETRRGASTYLLLRAKRRPSAERRLLTSIPTRTATAAPARQRSSPPSLPCLQI